MVTGESERYEGTARELQGSGENRVLLVESPHSDEPIRIPFDALSMLYFRKQAGEEAFPADFTVTLAADGDLSFTKPTLTEDHLSMTHPLLGEISVRREALVTLESLSESSSDTNQ